MVTSLNRAVRIVYFGDSITYGLGHDHKGVDSHKIWTALVENRLRRLEEVGIFVYTSNQGINGDTTRHGIIRLEAVSSFRPYLVTVQFGYNDCNYWISDNGFPRVNPVSYKYNLIEIIDKLIAANVMKIILCTNYFMPIEKLLLNGKSWNENVMLYNEIVREVAEEKSVILCDIEKLFGKLDESHFLDEHGKWLHLSEKGNQMFADKIFPFIKEAIGC